MRVLVCGGRNYARAKQVKATLDSVDHQSGGISHLAQGGAAGADGLARAWAKVSGVPYVTYHALWGAHGKAAGPRRNRHMLDDSRPDLVVAFPGGRGTADMVNLALAAGVPVQQVPDGSG